MDSVGALLFDGFELLDVFGPLEALGPCQNGVGRLPALHPADNRPPEQPFEVAPRKSRTVGGLGFQHLLGVTGIGRNAVALGQAGSGAGGLARPVVQQAAGPHELRQHHAPVFGPALQIHPFAGGQLEAKM
jgi:hypothetical protein